MMQSKKKESFFFSIVLVVSLLQSPAFALKKSYIVYLGGHSHRSVHTQADIDRIRDSHHKLLGSVVGSTEAAKDAIFYSYVKHINGFAANIEEEHATTLSKHQHVISVFPNKVRQLHTTHSWSYLGLEESGGQVPDESIWKKARFGEDTIIGNLDTGVWPESASFKDEGFGPIPSTWNGICQNITCNRKLIGARYFNIDQEQPQVNSSNDSPRDTDGHGTHTLSTAGGNFAPGANVFGFGNGTAKGGSPKARVAAYKVCWDGCSEADIVAGFDAAIDDGVDIISMSLGSSVPDQYFNDGTAIGAFHAMKKGILVVASAGNDGPSDGSVANFAPWFLTVAASTTDRDFPSYVQLGNNKNFKGQSLSPNNLPKQILYPLITGTDAKSANALEQDAQLCQPGSLDPNKVNGKIVICVRGGNGRVNKGQQVSNAGGIGMILTNDVLNGNDVIADAHVLPASHITYTDGIALFSYINSTQSPMAYIKPAFTEYNNKPAPVMASFSSKGPNPITQEILKPDITAPGVSIIAAYTQMAGPAGENDTRRVLFNSESGTSMSCPHVAGIAGLLKTLHPDWSPAAIKSAIMTTARVQDSNNKPMLNSSYEKATPFSYGAGQVWPNSAMDPGLVYDLSARDYYNFLCAIGYNETQLISITKHKHKCSELYNPIDLNYPSITVPTLSGTVVVHRRVKNVGSPGTYTVSVEEPQGISVVVQPKTLKFRKIGNVKKFQVIFKAKDVGAARDYVFGSLTWSDGNHFVRSPIVLKAA